MHIAIVVVPFDTAARGSRMGAGPARLLEAGLAERLGAAGHTVRQEIVEPRTEPRAEIRTAFELMHAVADAVGAARQAGQFPLVLAGNCNMSVGIVAGLGRRVGVCWFDAHGDFNTPETTIGGFLDGMAMATVTGHCWRELAARVPGFTPVAEEHVLLIGARDLDPLEAERLATSAVRRVSPAAVREGGLQTAVSELAGRVASAYLHLDLDVLDPADGRVNAFAAAGGLKRAELLDAIATIGTRLRIEGTALTAYDPTGDADGRACAAALDAIDAIVRVAAAGPSAAVGAAGPA